MNISGITFDLWYTLIYETEEDEARYQEMRLMAIKKGLEEAGASFDEKILAKSFFYLRKFSLSIPFEAFLKLVVSSVNASLSEKQMSILKQRYIEEIEKYEVKTAPEVPDILEELYKKGLKIAIVSNTSFPERSLWKILEKKGISPYLKAIVSSSDEGVEKPSPVIFEIARKRLGLSSEMLMHVGDSCIEDYLGSIASGMKAALYTGLYQYRKEKVLHELCLLNSTFTVEKLSYLRDIIF